MIASLRFSGLLLAGILLSQVSQAEQDNRRCPRGNLTPDSVLELSYGDGVVLFIGETESGQPMFYEASGSASRVRLHYGAAYIDGYVPIRYAGIVDGTAVEASDPVESRDASSERSAVDDDGNEPVEEAGEAGLPTDGGELTDAPRWQIIAGVIATVVIATALSLLLGTVLRSRQKRGR